MLSIVPRAVAARQSTYPPDSRRGRILCLDLQSCFDLIALFGENTFFVSALPHLSTVHFAVRRSYLYPHVDPAPPTPTPLFLVRKNLGKGWDKTFCLQFLGEGTTEFDEIHFFGDKTFVVSRAVLVDWVRKQRCAGGRLNVDRRSKRAKRLLSYIIGKFCFCYTHDGGRHADQFRTSKGQIDMFTGKICL